MYVLSVIPKYLPAARVERVKDIFPYTFVGGMPISHPQQDPAW